MEPNRTVPIPALMSWSGGKDSCVALAAMLASGHYDIRGLLTTVTREEERISMHRVRRALLQEQAASIGLPLLEVLIPKDASNVAYEAALGGVLGEQKAAGVEVLGFGDLFLEDIRAYRDAFAARQGLRAVYPVWGRDTRTFMEDFIAAGFRAIVVCVDSTKLSPDFVGRMLDRDFLTDLPAGIDHCGENGEFHSFVFDGPIFTKRLAFSRGERMCRGSFWFCDLIPEPKHSAAA